MSTLDFRCANLKGRVAGPQRVNGCQLCLGFRTARDATQYLRFAGGDCSNSIVTRATEVPDEAFYQAVSQWRTSTLLSERERIAIEYAEGLGTRPQEIAADDEFWGRAKALFSDEEIVDISFCIASWMGQGRITHALGLDGVCSFAPSIASAAA